MTGLASAQASEWPRSLKSGATEITIYPVVSTRPQISTNGFESLEQVGQDLGEANLRNRPVPSAKFESEVECDLRFPRSSQLATAPAKPAPSWGISRRDPRHRRKRSICCLGFTSLAPVLQISRQACLCESSPARCEPGRSRYCCARRWFRSRSVCAGRVQRSPHRPLTGAVRKTPTVACYGIPTRFKRPARIRSSIARLRFFPNPVP